MSAGGNIDVTIPGSESSVDDAATWLEGMRDNANSVGESFSKNSAVSGAGGEVALAVGAYSSSSKDASGDVHDRVKKAADVIRSFADQLSWRKQDMKEHLETARGDGLQIDGNIIKYPEQVSVPGKFPQKGTKKARGDWLATDEAYDNYLAKVRNFEKIKGGVETTFNALNDWIINSLVMAKQDTLQAHYPGSIETSAENVIGNAARDGDYVENSYSPAADVLRDTVYQWTSTRAAESSHNLSVQTRSRPPSKKVTDNKLNKPRPMALRRTADGLETVGDGLRKYAGKAAAFDGPAVDLAPGELLVKVATMTAVGIITVALLPEAVSIGGIILVAGVAAVVSEGIGWVYDNAISLENREKTNHPWGETKEGVGTGITAAENWAEDTGGYLEGKGSDAWNRVSAQTWDKFGIQIIIVFSGKSSRR